MSKVREKDILDEELGDMFKMMKHSELPEAKKELKPKDTIVPFKGKEIVIYEDVLQERGYRLWKACHFLAVYLAQFSETEFAGKRAIELGSGTGLGGITLAHLGAHVTLTVLPIIQINVDANVQKNPALKDLLAVAPLTWGDDVSFITPPNPSPLYSPPSPPSSPSPSSPSSSSSSSTTTEVVKDTRPVDIILASDVLYSEEAHAPLLFTLAALSTPATHIIFAYERRKKSNDKFFTKASKWFDWTTLTAGQIIDGANDSVTIYLMKKKLSPSKKATGRAKEREFRKETKKDEVSLEKEEKKEEVSLEETKKGTNTSSFLDMLKKV